MGKLHTCYSPVRRSPADSPKRVPAAPRLACVKPVASVHPEPGSNSSLLLSFFLFLFVFKNRSNSRQSLFSRPAELYRSLQFLTESHFYQMSLVLVLLRLYCNHFNVLSFPNLYFKAEKCCKINTYSFPHQILIEYLTKFNTKKNPKFFLLFLSIFITAI